MDKKVSKLESCELFEDTFSTPQHDPVESVDLEDGELFGEDNEVSSNTIKKEDNRMPICRYHIRNCCIWGQNCRFRHPNLNRLGKYVMFEKKCLPVPTVTFPPGMLHFESGHQNLCNFFLVFSYVLVLVKEFEKV